MGSKREKPGRATSSLLPRFIEREEYRSMARTVYSDKRDLLLLSLLYHYCLTVNECRQIKIKHLKPRGYDKGILTIPAEYKPQNRVLRLRKQTWQNAKDIQQSENLDQEDFLFRSRKGRYVTKGEDTRVRAPISTRQIRHIVKKCAKDAGIRNHRDVSPKALRYGGIVYRIRNLKGQVQKIERWLGLRHDPRRAKMLLEMAGLSHEEQQDPAQKTYTSISKLTN